MADTKIEWATKVWNPVTGCSKVSPGCAHCYAEVIAKRFWGDRKFTDVQCHRERLEHPRHWRKPQRIFVNSMSDLFHDDVPINFIHEVWDVMKSCPQHTFMILTKRPERMKIVLEKIYSWQRFGHALGFWRHVWLGVTVENQEMANERIPILLQIPASIRIVCCEPLLGPIILRRKAIDEREMVQAALMGRLDEYSRPVERGIDWVICGGESGHGARFMQPNWVKSIRDQCLKAGVPFFFKQWGEFIPDNQDPEVGIGKDWQGIRVGKKAAGRLLDGREWNEFPIKKVRCF